MTYRDEESRLAELLQRLDEESAGGPSIPTFDEFSLSIDLPPELLEQWQDAKEGLRYLHDLQKVIGRESVGVEGDSTWKGASSFTGDIPEPGSRLGRFEIVRCLGQGGFASVFLARDPALDRDIALKILRPEAMSNSDSKTRFQRESRVAAMLGHDAIVPVYESGSFGPLHYIVYDYCAGDSLAHWLSQSDRRLSFTQIARLIARVADGLHHAHQRGLIHRDIKPSNLLISDEWSPSDGSFQPIVESVRVGDFGLAKSTELDELTLTRAGGIVGTPAYMSPEQALGHQAICHRSDIYSLGSVFYELMTGESPHRKETYLDTLKSVENEVPAQPNSINAEIPKDLQAICMKCLEKHPNQRYADAFELAEDLNRWLTDKPVIARQVGALGKLVRWSKRNRAIAASLTFAFVSLVIGLALVSWKWWDASTNLQEAQRQAHRAAVHRERTERAIEELISGFSLELADVPKTSQLRKQLLAKAIEFQQEIIAQESEQFDSTQSAESGLKLLQGYTRLSHMQLMLSEHQAVLESTSSCQELAEGLTTPLDEDDQEWLFELQLDYLRIRSEALLELQQETDAVQTVEQALELLPTDLSSLNAAQQVNAYSLLSHCASVFLRLGEFEKAEPVLMETFALVEGTTVHSVENSCVLLNQLAIQHKTRGDLKLAESCQRLAVKLWDQVSEAMSEYPMIRHNKAVASLNLGNTLAQMKDYEEATQFHESAELQLSKLYEDHPENVTIQRSLLSSRNSLGIDYKHLRKNDLAIEVYQRALELSPVVEEDRESRLLLRKIHNNVGNLHFIQEQFQEAEVSFLASLELVDLEAQSGMQRYESLYSNSYGCLRLAQIGSRTQRKPIAIQYSDEAVALAGELFESAKRVARYRENYFFILSGSFKVRMEIHDWEKCLELLDTLQEVDPSVKGRKIQLVNYLDLHTAIQEQDVTTDLVKEVESKINSTAKQLNPDALEQLPEQHRQKLRDMNLLD